MRQTWLKNAKITTDPRYGPDKQGYPSRFSASVSKAAVDVRRRRGQGDAVAGVS